MPKVSEVRWGKWAAVATGSVVLVKTTAYVGSKATRFAKNEVRARGGDVAFVLGLAERRKSGQS